MDSPDRMDIVRTAWNPSTFLGGLGTAARQMLARSGGPRRYPPGASVLTEGDTTTHVVIILSGWVKVTATGENGRQALLAIRRAGDIIGELAAMNSAPRIANVIAGCDLRTLEIDRGSFTEIQASSPDVAQAVGRTLAQRMQTATRRRVELSSYPVRIRLIRLLRDLTHAPGPPGAPAVPVPLSQAELAAAVGAAETSVHKVLRELRARGIVRTGYGRLTVLRPDALQELAGPA